METSAAYRNESNSFFSIDFETLKGEKYDKAKSIGEKILTGLKNNSTQFRKEDGQEVVGICSDDRMMTTNQEEQTVFDQLGEKYDDASFVALPGSGMSQWLYIRNAIEAELGDTSIDNNIIKLVALEKLSEYYKWLGITALTNHTGCGAANLVHGLDDVTGCSGEKYGRNFIEAVSTFSDGGIKDAGTVKLEDHGEHKSGIVYVHLDALISKDFYSNGEKGMGYNVSYCNLDQTVGDIGVLVDKVIFGDHGGYDPNKKANIVFVGGGKDSSGPKVKIMRLLEKNKKVSDDHTSQ